MYASPRGVYFKHVGGTGNYEGGGALIDIKYVQCTLRNGCSLTFYGSLKPHVLYCLKEVINVFVQLFKKNPYLTKQMI